MRYIPLKATNRTYVSRYWTNKQLRAIQVILNATHGVVGPKRSFVLRAFGKSLKEFETLLWMPEEYLMYREKHKEKGANEWNEQFESLSKQDKRIIKRIVKNNNIDTSILKIRGNAKIERVLKHYTLLLRRTRISLA
jgi:hypothetical protein